MELVWQIVLNNFILKPNILQVYFLFYKGNYIFIIKVIILINSATFTDLYNCYDCPCTTPYAYFAFYNPAAYIYPTLRGFYSCETSCIGSSYYRLKIETIPIDAAGTMKNIYNCYACPNSCLTCTNNTYCLTCN
jgi:hypothetical protein